MKRRKLTALALALCCGTAGAGEDYGHDHPGFHGYFRIGAGASSRHGPMSCYGLGGNTMKYRLGNECDSYAEFGYTHEMPKTDDGVTFAGTIWLNSFAPNSSFSGPGSEVKLAKAYVEAKGLDFLNGGVAWMGKRFYIRPDIHMLDLQYIHLNGTGAGVDQVKLGPGHISYAIFKDNDRNILDPVTGARTETAAAIRQNLLYQDLPVNPNGTIDAVGTLITAQGGPATHNGWQLLVMHKQDKLFGEGNNIFGVQYGVGPGTGRGAPLTGEDGAGGDTMGKSGSTLLGSDAKRLRVFDALWTQLTRNFGVQAVVLVQRDKSNAGGTTTWTTLGIRPIYAFTRYLKLQGELGTDRVSSATGGPAARLTKLTIAPTLSRGPGVWDRPELRAFITYGKWNNAATALVNAANNSGPVYNNGTSGTTIGFQVETWW